MLVDLCLMNKNTKIMYFTANITDLSCEITAVGSILSPINCPEFILNMDDKKKAIKTWWQLRVLPNTRRDITNVITLLYHQPLSNKHVVDNGMFLLSLLSYAQNLKDHYWINPAKEYKIAFQGMAQTFVQSLIPSTYENINFYSNLIMPEEDEIFKVILDCQRQPHPIQNYFSPNLCIQGDKIKFWLFNDDNNKYCLHKYLHGVTEIEENEMKVYEFIKKETPELASEPTIVKIDVTDYLGYTNKKAVKKYVRYDNFITEDIELVTGDDILLAQGPQRGDVDEIFLENCSYLGIPINFVNEVVYISDALDRHFGMEEEVEYDNIGFLRDCKTKKFIAPAPIFGNSYFQSIL